MSFSASEGKKRDMLDSQSEKRKRKEIVAFSNQHEKKMSSTRLNVISQHLAPAETTTSPTSAKVGVKSPNDVVIVSAVRTPIAKGKRGSFKDAAVEDMLVPCLRGVCERAGVDPKVIDDVQVGNVNGSGASAAQSRMALFEAGYPTEVSVAAVNRQCSSGLQACAVIASAISAGFIDVGVGAGVESMSFGTGEPEMRLSEKMGDFPLAADCLVPMGITSENVAEEFGVSRKQQDEMAVASHLKAAKAQAAGYFDSEIVPVKVTVEKDGEDVEVTVTKDEGIRGETTFERLSKLKPAFKEGGSTTAGNSSQVSDGAAAVLMMRRSKAEQLGCKPLATFRAFAVAGVPPLVMGIGPAFAIPKVLEQAGVTKDQVDVYEINEAFASQAVYCVEKLGLDYKKVNPQGGAIALGHPLGCTGARQIATLIPELKRMGGKVGVTSMCIGTGMGAASLIELE
eukprot:Lithocolla_globosa_v1_NODE_3491_length_1657_cov_154.129838.p1 type:complete len:454 gc:universal NODE_3491_length_1657_cov_154.129838:1611-250(-)